VKSKGEWQNYSTTGGLLPISSSWGQTPRNSRPVFFSSTEYLRLYSLCNIFSDERMGLSFTIAAGPRQRSHVQVRVLRDTWPHLSQIRDFLNLTARSPYLFPPGKGWSSYPQALGSILVASYDSQGHGGGIWTRVHMGYAEWQYTISIVLWGRESLRMGEGTQGRLEDCC
jgi:hypothetical protein